MASAGRILIMPRGNYDASLPYEKLDLVSHNGYAWLAKKTVEGIEPSEENAEYWHNMFDLSKILSSTNAEVSYEGDVFGALYTYKNDVSMKLIGRITVNPEATSSKLKIGQVKGEYYPSQIVPFTAFNFARGSYPHGYIDTDGSIYLQILEDAVGKENSIRFYVCY